MIFPPKTTPGPAWSRPAACVSLEVKDAEGGQGPSIQWGVCRGYEVKRILIPACGTEPRDELSLFVCFYPRFCMIFVTSQNLINYKYIGIS